MHKQEFGAQVLDLKLKTDEEKVSYSLNVCSVSLADMDHPLISSECVNNGHTAFGCRSSWLKIKMNKYNS
jgi:hypothetical protein